MNKSEIAEEAVREIRRHFDEDFDTTITGEVFDRELLQIVERAIAESQPDKIQQFWNAQAEWSQATFGTDAECNHMGPLKHLAKEAVEAQVQPADPVEIADCLFLVFDAARRAGMTLDTLISVAEQKLLINKARKWNKPMNSEAFAEHVRELGDGEPSPRHCPHCEAGIPRGVNQKTGHFNEGQFAGWCRYMVSDADYKRMYSGGESGAAQEVSPRIISRETFPELGGETTVEVFEAVSPPRRITAKG